MRMVYIRYSNRSLLSLSNMRYSGHDVFHLYQRARWMRRTYKWQFNNNKNHDYDNNARWNGSPAAVCLPERGRIRRLQHPGWARFSRDIRDRRFKWLFQSSLNASPCQGINGRFRRREVDHCGRRWGRKLSKLNTHLRRICMAPVSIHEFGQSFLCIGRHASRLVGSWRYPRWAIALIHHRVIFRRVVGGGTRSSPRFTRHVRRSTGCNQDSNRGGNVRFRGLFERVFHIRLELPKLAADRIDVGG